MTTIDEILKQPHRFFLQEVFPSALNGLFGSKGEIEAWYLRQTGEDQGSWTEEAWFVTPSKLIRVASLPEVISVKSFDRSNIVKVERRYEVRPHPIRATSVLKELTIAFNTGEEVVISSPQAAFDLRGDDQLAKYSELSRTLG